MNQTHVRKSTTKGAAKRQYVQDALAVETAQYVGFPFRTPTPNPAFRPARQYAMNDPCDSNLERAGSLRADGGRGRLLPFRRSTARYESIRPSF
jgi:hypothetical protein